MISKRTVAGTILGTSLLISCVVDGPAFEDPTPPPTDRGLIYFYRPPEIHGAALTVTVMDNKAIIASLKNGQYIVTPIKPGTHVISSNVTQDAITLEIAPGETYYVRFIVASGFIKPTPTLMRIYPADAVAELRDCCKGGTHLTEMME